MAGGACAGAGEDVEGVLARLNAQASENALLRERQAKANSDMQVCCLASHPCQLLLVRTTHASLLSTMVQLLPLSQSHPAEAMYSKPHSLDMLWWCKKCIVSFPAHMAVKGSQLVVSSISLCDALRSLMSRSLCAALLFKVMHYQKRAVHNAQALEERLRLVRAQRNKLLSAFETLKGSGMPPLDSRTLCCGKGACSVSIRASYACLPQIYAYILSLCA